MAVSDIKTSVWLIACILAELTTQKRWSNNVVYSDPLEYIRQTNICISLNFVLSYKTKCYWAIISIFVNFLPSSILVYTRFFFTSSQFLNFPYFCKSELGSPQMAETWKEK